VSLAFEGAQLSLGKVAFIDGGKPLLDLLLDNLPKKDPAARHCWSSSLASDRAEKCH
jgi:hypothetical protein